MRITVQPMVNLAEASGIHCDRRANLVPTGACQGLLMPRVHARPRKLLAGNFGARDGQ